MSNGSPPRPCSFRSSLMRSIIGTRSSSVPPAPIQPSPRRAARRSCTSWCPTDEHGDGPRRYRLHLDRGELVELAVVLEVPAGREAAHDLDALVEAPATTFP